MELAGSRKPQFAGVEIPPFKSKTATPALPGGGDRFFRGEPYYSFPRSVLLKPSMVSCPVTIRSKSELLT
jgi:hypothetical protein